MKVLEGEEKEVAQKNYLKKIMAKTSRFGKRHKRTDFKTSAKLKQDKPKEVHAHT